jgi:hypothetical protein
VELLHQTSALRKHVNLVAGLICFAGFLIFYGLTSRTALQTSDEAAVFYTGVSLVTRGEFAIDELQWLQDRMNIGQLGRDGHLYMKYFPGNMLGVALVYKLAARPNDHGYRGPWGGVMEFAPSETGARWAMKLNAVWGALGITALLLLSRRHFAWPTAIITALLIGICSDWWYQSRGLFSEVGAGAFLIVSLCFAAYGKPYGSATGLAFSILFRPTNLLALPIWGWSVWDKGFKTLVSILIIVAGVSALGLFNWLRFGSPLNFGYGDERFGSSLVEGLYGVLLSPGRSIFVYSPVLLLAVPGTFLFFRKAKLMTIICVITVMVHAFTIASWHSWDGGVSWGSRLMTPIVPVLGVLMGPTIEYCRRNIWIGVSVILVAAMGLTVQVAALLRSPTGVIVEHVATGEISYEDTIHTIHNCWLALQIRGLRGWQPCQLDAYTLRRWLTNCPQ